MDISIKIEYMHLLNPAISLPNMLKKKKKKKWCSDGSTTWGRYLISFSCIPTMVKMLTLCVFCHKKTKNGEKSIKEISTKCNVGSFLKPALNKSTVKGHFCGNSGILNFEWQLDDVKGL